MNIAAPNTYIPPVKRAAAPIPYPSQGEVIGALETPDRQSRVEVVLRGRDQHYRIMHGDNVLDAGADQADLERLLGEAGVDLADLVDVTGQLVAAAPKGAA